jgi:hypothetical protein
MSMPDARTGAALGAGGTSGALPHPNNMETLAIDSNFSFIHKVYRSVPRSKSDFQFREARRPQPALLALAIGGKANATAVSLSLSSQSRFATVSSLARSGTRARPGGPFISAKRDGPQ